MTAWMDAHNHLQDLRLGDVGPVVEQAMAVGVTGCVVHATGEDDWQRVVDLAQAYPGFVRPAFGVHPWQAGGVKVGWQERLRACLLAFPDAVVGEIGLDQWVSEPSLEEQLAVFKDQLTLAHALDRSVTIHCLKAWSPMLEVLASVRLPRAMLFHSFGGSIEVARRLASMGAYFSFSGYFLHPRKQRVVEVFRQLPKDRILLETDAPDMLPPEHAVTHPLSGGINHPANLVAVGRELARHLELSADELADLTMKNTRRCFGFSGVAGE